MSFIQIIAARRLDRLTDLKADLESKYGVKVIASALDLADPTSADNFYEELPADVRDNVDVLVNNAGAFSQSAPVYSADWDELGSIIDVNVKGVVKMIKLFVPGMLKRQSGHIINVSSIVAKDVLSNHGVYSGSKAMLEAINTSLRAELVATPLRVSLISPGLTQTELTSTAYKSEEKGNSWFTGYQPLLPEDIADGTVFIASRPPHVQVVDLIIYPTAQASVHALHRENSQ